MLRQLAGLQGLGLGLDLGGDGIGDLADLDLADAAQQAADPTFVIPAGKPVQANDSGSVFSDLMMLGPCTLHQYVEPEPTPGEGYYDENGNWVPAGETDPTDPTESLSAKAPRTERP